VDRAALAACIAAFGVGRALVGFEADIPAGKYVITLDFAIAGLGRRGGYSGWGLWWTACRGARKHGQPVDCHA
jgi:hypothetical protein